MVPRVLKKVSGFTIILLLIGVPGTAQTDRFVSPAEIPVGSPGILLTISQRGFPASGSIRVQQVSLEFRSYATHVEAFLPEVLLSTERTLLLELSPNKDAEPIRSEIKVVSKRFQGALTLVVEKTKVTRDEPFSLNIRLTNYGKTPVYIPAEINPFVVGHVQSASEFELITDESSVPFHASLIEGVGGVRRRTDSDFLRAAEIIRLEPGYSYGRELTTDMNALSTYMRNSGRMLKPGVYRLRLCYYGFSPAVQSPPQIPFLDEIFYSNEIRIEVF